MAWTPGEQTEPRPAPTLLDTNPKVLVTDLDGTLLGGDDTDRRLLRAALDRHPEVTVVFATGRGLPSVERILSDDPLVPRPRWIIADVGASVIDGVGMSRVDLLESRLRAGWPGQRRVRSALAGFTELVHQDAVAQDGRCSFYLRPEQLSRQLTDAVRELDCGWTYSADRYFDVLPAAASKGNALALLARKHQWPMDSVLVAGDSLNDLSLFRLGAHGVLMGNAEPALGEQLPDGAAVHRPDRRGAAAILSALEDLGWVERTAAVVVGYHRPPVRRADGGWRRPLSPNGILPTLRSMFATTDMDAVWATSLVGGEALHGEAPPGEPLGGAPVHDASRHGASRHGASRHGASRHDASLHAASLRSASQETGLPLAILPVTAAQWTGYFHRACKETLWPVLMSQPERMRHDPAAWTHYETMNNRFADHISAHAARDATVWLHDYNLWLVPGILRATRPDLRLGLFHHTPFPPPETFARIPDAARIRGSLACLDWAGFHTAVFADHFRRTLADGPRTPRTGIHPLGIDRPMVEALARSRAPHPRTDDAAALVLSVERLDYAKAPLQKIRALSTLLTERPELRGRLRFRLICPPPEPGIRAYDSTREALERDITALNDTWRTDSWQPVDYIPRALPFAEVVDHYLAADVLWVTSLQDGMNLTAKEFIAAQAATGRSGVLVLSRSTGAAAQLAPTALLTDPRSPRDLVDTLHRALTMPPRRRRTRMARLAALLDDPSPAVWAHRIITAIRQD
ncbi:trehalose-6-phosphate synthase [Streptomyces sp. NPDC017993]|uniref:trehalose-6-phosphate synthase n=1 Tax=Streptomyces sp. NPDC017993 TaxID=3365027 RepID=UPI00379181F9